MEKKKSVAQEDSDLSKSGSDRDDPNRTEPAYRQFSRDKRKRIVRVEKNPRLDPPQQKSLAEQFDRDDSGFNRVGSERKPSPSYRDREERPKNPSNSSYGREGSYDRTSGRDRSYGGGSANRERSTGGYAGREKPHGRSYGEKPYVKERESGERTPYKKEYTPRGSEQGRGSRNFSSYGSKSHSQYGSRSPHRSSGTTDRRFPRNDEGQRYQGGNQRPKGKYPPKSKAPAYDSTNYPKFPREPQLGEVRLNRYLAMSGIASRREADELISAGLVTVNGVVVTELGSKVQPEDVVRYNDNIIRGESKVYIVMNKPKGYVTTLDDPHAEKTVMDLLKNSVKERVYPVGRLDKNSLGVLLITNDGEMTKKLTHPSYNKKKIYQVTLDKALTKADMQKLAEGVVLEDGEIHADNIDYVGESKKDIGIEIHSGRNRIIRRMFDHLGYTVLKLDRVYFAGLTKKNLKRGLWRFLTPREVDTLHNGKYE